MERFAAIIQRVTWKVPLVGIGVLLAILFSLFSGWELSDETSRYWVFARVFAETGDFIIPDRSPLYTLYLNAFRWLGYPASIDAEYVVTSLILVVSLAALFRRYMGLGLGIIAALLWVPYMQWAEPPVQKLALASSCWAILLRSSEGNRSRFAASYALLGLAYLFRATYIILPVIFLTWDLYHLVRRGGVQGLVNMARPRFSYWPIGVIVALFLLFSLVQSSHRWNNVFSVSTTWFPMSGKSLAEGQFFQHFNNGYILKEYGTFEGHDIYVTNQEVFDGADSLFGALRANPQFIAEQVGRNVKGTIELSPQVTAIWWFYQWLPRPGGVGSAPFYGVAVVVLALGFYGAIRASRNDTSMVLFLAGSVLLTGVMIAGLPKLRFLMPLIPVCTLAGFWYGTQARRGLVSVLQWGARPLIWLALIGGSVVTLWLILRLALGPSGRLAVPIALLGYLLIIFFVVAARYLVNERARRWLVSSTFLVIPAALVLFSNGANGWWHTAQGAINDAEHQRTRQEIRGSFGTLESLVRDCSGIMALESAYFGAFMDVPLDRVYDLFEVPPVGSLGDSTYDGLQPSRIDCVLESDRMVNVVGNSLNIQLRHQNYVEPYIEQLQALGATTHEIEPYGRAIILTSDQ